MTFQTLQKFNQDEANPFDVVHTSSDTYVASDRELVITEANEVSLPEPEDNAIVGIRDTGQRAVITSPSSQIHLREDGVIRAEETVYFVSDGTNWYTISDSEWFGAAIPDSGLLHDYDAATLSLSNGETVNEWEDAEGDEPLNAVGSPTYGGGGDHPTVSLDGTDDAFDSSHDIDQPLAIFIVFDQMDQSGEDFIRLFSSDEDNVGSFKWQDRPIDNDTRYNFGDDTTVSMDHDPSLQIRSAIADGDESAIRRNGSEIDSSDAGTNRFVEMGWFYRRHRGDENVGGDVLRMLVYDLNDLEQDSSVQKVEESLNDEYGVY